MLLIAGRSSIGSSKELIAYSMVWLIVKAPTRGVIQPQPV